MKQKPTYQELEKELKEFRTTNLLIEKSPIVRFLWKNQEGWPVEHVSENVKNIFGYTADDFLSGKINYSEILYPDDAQRVGDEVSSQSKIDNYSIKHEPYRIISKTGEIKWLNDITLIRRNETNKITHFEGIILDITKQKETEIKIQLRETYLAELIKINDISFKSHSNADLQKFVEIIGKVANASRTYVFKNHRNQNNELLLSQVAEYVADGIKPELDNPDLQNLNYNDWVPRWEKILKSGGMIRGKVASFPEKERYLLEPQGIISLVVIPIFVDNTYWGFLGFDNCVDNNEWNDIDIKYFTIATKRLEHSIEIAAKQKSLDIENKRFKITMDAMNSGVYVIDMFNHKLLFLNKFFVDLFGDKTGEKCYKALRGLDEPCKFCSNSNSLEKNKNSNKTHVWEAQNEISKRWYQHRDHEIDWVDGRTVRMGEAIDITDQIEANKQIRMHSQFVKTTSQSVLIADLEENIIFVNEALLKTGGFDHQNEIIGKSTDAFTDEQGVIKLKQEILPSIFEKGYYNGELNFRKKDNTIYLGEISCSFIPNKTGEPEFFVAMFNDITGRKQVEKDLILAKEKAEESNRLKSAFINNMSHEIRTPLNGINGFLELLLDSNYEVEDKKEYIDIIKTSSDRLITTVTDIMEISKIEAGLLDLSEKEVTVNGIFNEIFNSFSIDAKEKNLSLKQIPSLSDNEAKIFIDNQKLTGILTNLIKNAIKFTNSGSVTFGYKLKADILEFYVKDTGIGIPKNRQQAIFNRFEQADIEDTRVYEGSGLGLAIAKSYVEVMGGKIWLNSKEGVGTEFTFTIPYKTKSQLPIANNQLPTAKKSLKSLTVLIVEDEKVNNQFFEIIFKNTFKHIIYVETGQTAIDGCKNNPEIDLILMDIKMPVMNGYTATREIRKFNKDVIIIAQTAFGMAGDKRKAIEAGCNDYITKPIDKDQLLKMIKLNF